MKTTQIRLVFLLTFCLGIFFWGYTHFETTGTFFYPFLGRGFSCYDPPYFIFEYGWPLGKIINTFLDAFWHMPIFLLCCTILILHLFFPTHLKRSLSLTLLIFAVAVGLAILCRFGPFERTNPSAYLRYGIPFWQALLVFSLWEFKWKEWGTNFNRLYKDKKPLGLLVLLTIFFLIKTVEMRWLTFERAVNYKETRIKYETVLSPTKLGGYFHKAQQTTPAHKRI